MSTGKLSPFWKSLNTESNTYMSVRTILFDLATEGAIKLTNDDQLTYWIFRVNKAAKELFDSFDLVGSLQEQIFSTANVSSGIQVTLPYYVGKIRAVRFAQNQMNVGLRDMRPRYASRFWQSEGFLSWRLKDERPIKQDITNASLLTLTFEQAVTGTVKVTIKGKTEYAHADSETLTFSSGDTSKDTTKSFSEITAITKDTITGSWDLNVIDVDGNVLAILPNNQLRSLYQMVDLVNLPALNQTFSTISDYVEVLFKVRYQTLNALDDEFQCAGYDDVILWKVREHIATTSKDPQESSKAVGYALKVADLVKQRSEDQEQNTSQRVNLAPEPIFEAFASIDSDQLHSMDGRPQTGNCS